MTFLENVDKAKLQKILLITISALLLVALALLLVIIVMSIEPSGLQENPDMEFTDLVIEEKDLQTGSLVLADADHLYSVDKSLLDLIICRDYRESQKTDEDSKNYYATSDKSQKMNKDAMIYAHNMLVDASRAIADDYFVLIDSALDGIYREGSNPEEFKTGLLISFSDYDSTAAKYIALNETYSKWLKDNAANYGFIESFEDGYRYVGAPHAKYITEKKLALEDYISYLKENTTNEKGLIIKADDCEYYIYYATVKAGESVRIPADCDYVVSGTNEGGVIVTAKLEK